jgi:hypothetical protein
MRFNNMMNKWMQLVISLFIVLIIGCEYDAPVNPWEEKNKVSDIVPVITQVLPAPEDAETASEITILGEHFSSVPAENNVFFMDDSTMVSKQAVVKSSTSSQIIVYRPSIIADSITISITVGIDKNGYTGVGRYSYYKLGPVMNSFGIFLDDDSLTAFTITDDTISYALLRDRYVLKLSSGGERDTSYSVRLATAAVTDLKMGPGGYLYFLRSNDRLFRISPDNGNVETVVTFGSGKTANFFDFDNDGNIYAGGANSGLIVIKPDASMSYPGIYDSYNITSIRVFEEYVYVAAFNETASAVWRHQIQSAEGTLGSQDLVFDWTTAGEYAQSVITDITFSESGDLYVATNYTYPLFVVKEGILAPVYYGLIDCPIKKMAWGPGNYLYILLSRKSPAYGDRQLLKINLGERGAPYLGQQ